MEHHILSRYPPCNPRHPRRQDNFILTTFRAHTNALREGLTNCAECGFNLLEMGWASHEAAAASTDAARADAFAARRDVPTYYDSYEAM